MSPPAYPEVTLVTPFILLKMASVHQKHPPAKVAVSILIIPPFEIPTTNVGKLVFVPVTSRFPGFFKKFLGIRVEISHWTKRFTKGDCIAKGPMSLVVGGGIPHVIWMKRVT